MLACELSPYKYDPESEPRLALTDANAVLASEYVESEDWLNEQDWHPMSAAAAQSSTSSGGYYRLGDGQTNQHTGRLEEEIPLTHKMVALFDAAPLHSYSVTAEVKAADEAASIDLSAVVRNELRFQLPDGSYSDRPFSQTVFDETQLTDEWTSVEGKFNAISRYGYVFFDSEYGAFTYRNLQVQVDQPLTPQPDFSELSEALTALPAEWQRVNVPNLAEVADNYAWLPGQLVHGGTASCQAGSVDGLSFDFHITEAVPRYRLNLELEVVGVSAGTLELNLYGTVLRGSWVIGASAFENVIYSGEVEPGDVLNISEEFDYLPFNEMRAMILSDAVEFLVHNISLERIYDVDTDEQPAPEVPAETDL